MIKLSKHTFVRHYGGLSLLINQRNDAQYLLRDAELFLRFIDRVPRREEEIVSKIAEECGGKGSTLAEDFRCFIAAAAGVFLCGKDEASLEQQEERFHYCRAADPGSAPSADVEISADPRSGKETNGDVSEYLTRYFSRHPTPVELHMDLTSACTERCVHCYLSEYPDRFLPFETIVRILDEFRAMNGLRVTFSGGEPMLHPQFCEILRYARKKDLIIHVLSNLTVLNEDIVSVLADVDIHYLQTSVYSMDPEVHDGITSSPGSFQKTMRGIRSMREHDIPLKINTPVMKENFRTWETVKDFARDQNYKFMSNADLTGRTNGDTGNLEHGLRESELACYLRSSRECDAWGRIARKAADEHICGILEQKINVDPQGNYYPCDGCHGMILGNCRDSSLDQVWNGARAGELRSLKQIDFAECFACAEREFCKVCPVHNFNETGDVFVHSSRQCMIAGLKHKIYEERSC